MWKVIWTLNIHVKSEALCPWDVSCSENMGWLRKSLSNDGKIWRNFSANSHWQGCNIGILVLHSLYHVVLFIRSIFFQKHNWRNKEQYSWLPGFSVQYPDLYIPNPWKIISDWATLSSELHSWFRFCNSEFF